MQIEEGSLVHELNESEVSCPYCGEQLHVLIDSQEAGQQYIEDCQVCCSPIVFNIFYDETGALAVSVYSENDVF